MLTLYLCACVWKSKASIRCVSVSLYLAFENRVSPFRAQHCSQAGWPETRDSAGSSSAPGLRRFVCARLSVEHGSLNAAPQAHMLSHFLPRL